MGRIADAILQGAYATGRQAPMLDLKYGGMNGFAPDLSQWVSNAAYIRHNLVCLLVEAPLGFSYLPNGDDYVQALKALVELHPQSITGLNAGLTVETSETPVGGAGQRQQDPTDVKEEVSNPAFRWTEKYGRPIQSFLRSWITDLIMDPNSKFANIATFGSPPTDMLPDMFAATMLFFEPDPTHTKIMNSWLVTNMYPLGTGEIVGARDLTAAGAPTEIETTFSGIALYSLGVDLFAQAILDGISITGANPQARASFATQIDADVAAAAKGYAANVEQLAETAVQL